MVCIFIIIGLCCYLHDSIFTFLRGASYVLPLFGVTLRRGSRDYFYDRVERIFPKMAKRYQTYFEDRSECISPNAPYLNEVFYRRIETLGISATMKFYHSEGRKQLSLF